MRRYEKKRPGELIHLDVKKLGRFKFEGHRVTAAFLRRAAAWFAEHGVRVRRVMTDNRSAYVAKDFAVLAGHLELA